MILSYRTPNPASQKTEINNVSSTDAYTDLSSLPTALHKECQDMYTT